MTRFSAMVCISGRVGSGKSFVADALAGELGSRVLSFGDFVKSVARSTGGSDSRDSLVDIGQSWVDRDCEEFVAAALSFVGWSLGESLVVDGLRHHCVRSVLEARAGGQPFFHLHVRTPTSIRSNRLKQRGEARELAALDRDATERDVSTLAELADLIVNGESEVETLVAAVMIHPRLRLTDRYDPPAT